MNCVACGDKHAPVIPVNRHGLKNKAARALYTNTAFCWACWYLECANEHLYDRKNAHGICDKLLFDQLSRFNDKAKPRMRGGYFAVVTPDEAMSVLLQGGGA
jgi:hypothetical protein